MGVTTIAINGEALKAEFKKRHITLVDAGKQLGYGKSWLQMSIINNRLAKSAVKLMQVEFGINPDVYVVKEEPKVEQKKEGTQLVEVVQRVGLSEDDQKALYKIIYTAAYEAMKRALNE